MKVWIVCFILSSLIILTTLCLVNLYIKPHIDELAKSIVENINR